MASDAEICNDALSYIGSTSYIQNLATESSDEAKVCRRHLQKVKDLVVRQFPWQFCRKYAALGLVVENPNDEYAFEYGYPSDCIRALWITLSTAGLATNAGQSILRRSSYAPPFGIGYGSSGRVIWTDQEDAILVYSRRITDAQRFPEDVAEAIAWGLAAAIAPTQTRSAGLASEVRRSYKSALLQAMANEENETSDDIQPEAEHIRARSVGSDYSGQGGGWQPYASGYSV